MANMVQLRILEGLDAVLLVDKPCGMAFSTVVKTVKRKFNLVKVGHGGSLDAAASGLLILLINEANKFVGDIMGADRAYTGTMRLGIRTNTGDIHGEVLARTAAVPPPADIATALDDFRGDIFQTEPRFCTVRREGAAAYETADTGDHAPFLAHVWRFGVGEVRDGRLPFEVVATKGLILRALVDDFGAAIGCGAALESARRTRIGKFTVDEAIPFERLLETDIKDFASCTIPLAKALQ